MSQSIALPREEESEGSDENELKYTRLHGTMMITAWIVFASTAILFARFGRNLAFGSKKKLLGEAIWFQFHRLFACLASVLTLLGFFFILVASKGTWVETDEGLEYVHSILGVIVFSIGVFQAWIALFRCHPDGAYRFIFNWIHRLAGVVSFLLSIPTLFTIAIYLDSERTGMIIILSIWSAWIVIATIVLQLVSIFAQKFSRKQKYRENNEFDLSNPDRSTDNSDDSDSKTSSKIIIFILSTHVCVSLALAIALIVLVWT